MVRRQTSQTASLAPVGFTHEEHPPNAHAQPQRTKARAAGSLSALATPLPQHGAGMLAAPQPSLPCSAIRVRRSSPVRGLDVERRKLVSPGRGAIAASLGATAVQRLKDRFVALPHQDSRHRLDEVDQELEESEEKESDFGPMEAASRAPIGELRGRITVMCVAESLDLCGLKALLPPDLQHDTPTFPGEGRMDLFKDTSSIGGDVGEGDDQWQQQQQQRLLQRHELEDLVLSWQGDPESVYVQTRESAWDNTPADVFFFDYGVVACWGLTPKQELDVIARLARPCQLDPLSSAAVQTDVFEFHHSANEPPHIKNDVITINRRQAADHRVKLAISHALAQCAKLSVCEERVMDLVGEVRHLPEAMAQFGEIRMSRKQVAQLMGKVFLQKSAVNLLSSVLDTPEYFWNQPDSLQALYRRSCEYLDLTGRIELVNSRFEVLQNMLDIWRDHANHMHIAALDAIIIWLIVIEIVLAAFEVFGYIGFL